MADQLEVYIAQQEDLLKLHEGKVIVMHGDQCQGDFATYLDAVNFVRDKGYSEGDYLVLRCTRGDGEYTGYFANLGPVHA